MKLPFLVGEVSKLESYGIDLDRKRISITGDIIDNEGIITNTHKAIIHLEDLSISQFIAVRTDLDIEIVDYDGALALMGTPEWKEEV